MFFHNCYFDQYSYEKFTAMLTLLVSEVLGIQVSIILEPATFGVPIVIGPNYSHHFADDHFGRNMRLYIVRTKSGHISLKI
jgi:hypothetical protein